MTLDELKKRLHDHNVPERWYSLDNGLKSDAIILYKNYYKWEYFYFDEKGNRLQQKTFDKEEEAFDYFWEKILRELQFFKRL